MKKKKKKNQASFTPIGSPREPAPPRNVRRNRPACVAAARTLACFSVSLQYLIISQTATAIVVVHARASSVRWYVAARTRTSEPDNALTVLPCHTRTCRLRTQLREGDENFDGDMQNLCVCVCVCGGTGA